MTPDEQAKITVPLEDWVRQIVHATVQEAMPVMLKRHEETCRINDIAKTVTDTDERLRGVEIRWSMLLGFLLGSGLLGGAAGGLIATLFGG